MVRISEICPEILEFINRVGGARGSISVSESVIRSWLHAFTAGDISYTDFLERTLLQLATMLDEANNDILKLHRVGCPPICLKMEKGIAVISQ